MTKTTVWVFHEENEWEGEHWKVFFQAPEELTAKLEELETLLKADEQLPYKLVQLDAMPTSFDDGVPTECENTEEGEEDCGDCMYCGEGEYYFAPESVGEVNPQVLEAALKFLRDSSATEDPLYKLALFG